MRQESWSCLQPGFAFRVLVFQDRLQVEGRSHRLEGVLARPRSCPPDGALVRLACMALSEAWRVQFAVSAQRSGFETRSTLPKKADESMLTVAPSQADAEGLTRLLDLPDEILSKVLENCNNQQKCSLAQTSSRFLRLASQRHLWAPEPSAVTLKHAIALCMSSILHLPPQVNAKP